MKKIVLLTLVSLIFATTAFSQEQKNAIKANPLGLIIGLGKLSYERELSASSSVQLGVSYFSYELFGSSTFSGFGLIPEYRFYPGADKEAIEGFYAAPFLVYNNFTVKDDDSKAALNIYGGGGKVGWNWLLGKSDGFVIDLSFGLRYTDGNLDVESGSDDDFDVDLWKGVRPDLNFAIGFAF